MKTIVSTLTTGKLYYMNASEMDGPYDKPGSLFDDAAQTYIPIEKNEPLMFLKAVAMASNSSESVYRWYFLYKDKVLQITHTNVILSSLFEEAEK